MSRLVVILKLDCVQPLALMNMRIKNIVVYSCFDNCHQEAKKGIEKPVAKNPATFMAKIGFDFEIVNGTFLILMSTVDHSRDAAHTFLDPQGSVPIERLGLWRIVSKRGGRLVLLMSDMESNMAVANAYRSFGRLCLVS